MMERKKATATMKDIAQECGFSINTVSRSLRGDTRISADTRKKILETADKLGYIRNSIASSLRSGRSYTVALLQSDMTNMHNSVLLSQIDDQLRENGYVTLILNSHDSPEIEEQLLKQVVSRNVDGVILFPTGNVSTPGTQRLIKDHFPLVLVHRRLEGIDCDLVEEDDYSGGVEAAKLLLEKGRRKLLYLAGPLANSSGKLRREGFFHTLAENGISREQVRIIEFNDMIEAIDRGRVLELLEPVDYDGIFAFYDHFAYQALYTLMRAGYKVPEEVAIVGFDNIRESYRYLPPLASISTAPGSSIAKETVDLLLRRIEEPDVPASKVMLPICVYDRDLIPAKEI